MKKINPKLFIENKHSERGNKYDAIVAATSRLMSEKGYKGATFDEIAEQVGIHKSSLFHYFKNKEELLLAILENSTEAVIVALEKIIDNTYLSPEQKLARAIETHLEYQNNNIHSIRVYHGEIQFLSDFYRKKYFKRRSYYASCFKKIVHEIQRSDSSAFQHFKDLDSDIITFGILGMCNWASKWFKESGDLTVSKVAETFFKMLSTPTKMLSRK